MSRSPRTAVGKTPVPPPPPSYAELEARIAALTAERDEALQRETATAERYCRSSIPHPGIVLLSSRRYSRRRASSVEPYTVV